MYISNKIKFQNIFIILCLFTLSACGGGSTGNKDDQADTGADLGNAPVTATTTAVDDAYTTSEDVVLVISDVLDNDTFTNGTGLSISSFTQPANGRVSQSGNSFIYTPNSDFNGTDQFTYTASLNESVSDVGLVTITVSSVDDQPLAENDTVDTVSNQTVSIPVLSNDEGLGDGGIAVMIINAPANGSASVTDNVISYTPNNNYHGADVLTYQVTDVNNDTATATVTIDVACDALCSPSPTTVEAINDTYATPEDVALVINDVLDNDLFTNGTGLSISSFTQPANGTISRSGNSFTYIPNRDFHGTDQFSYTASLSASVADVGFVTVTVNSVNDQPSAENDIVDATFNQTSNIMVLSNDGGLGDGGIVVRIINAPTNGRVSVTNNIISYTPSNDYHGSDRLTYQVVDENNDTSTATVSIEIACDASCLERTTKVEAVNDAYATPEDVALVINDVLDNDLFTNGTGLTISSFTQPANGTVSRSGNSFTYTPNSDFHGTDQFSYTALLGSSASDVGLVTITVSSVNDQPSAENDIVDATFNQTSNILVLSNDTGLGDGGVFVSIISPPLNGRVSAVVNNVISYTPNNNYQGTDTFTYRVTDANNDTATATVSIEVACNASCPTVEAVDDVYTTQEDTALVINDMLDNDTFTNATELLILSFTQPTNGRVTRTGNSFTYTPNNNFHGTDQFSYTASPSPSVSDVGLVTITVNSVNDFPSAESDTVDAVINQTLDISVLSNDSGLGDGGIAVTILDAPSNGSASVTDNVISYTPDSRFYGADTLTYQITDANNDTSTATVSIQVACDTLCPQDTTLTLSWAANASVEVVEGYLIYFVEGSTETLLSDISINDQGFSSNAPSVDYLIEDDLQRLAGDQACFKIIAYNTLGDSPSSNQVCATID